MTAIVLDRPRPTASRHDEPNRHEAGPVDQLPVDAVLALLPRLASWPTPGTGAGGQRLRGATRVLRWLQTHPSDGWQARWIAAGADHGLAWVEEISTGDPRTRLVNRDEICSGLHSLILARVLRPGYEFYTHVKAYTLFEQAPLVISPEVFAAISNGPAAADITGRQLSLARITLVKIALHTGRDLDALTAEDFFEYRDWTIRHGRASKGLHTAWELLARIGVLPAGRSLHEAVRSGQRSPAELVDAYRIASPAIRQVLVDYLDERRPSLDYISLARLANMLAGVFWADIEAHHPGIDTLNLPTDVVQAWKERLSVVTGRDGRTRPRKSKLDVLTHVRALYLDIQDWALENPAWARWAVPCPIRRSDTAGHVKARKHTSAQMHQRVRDRLPRLPALLDATEAHRADQAALLHAATQTCPGDLFDHNGSRYRRVVSKDNTQGPRYRGPDTVWVEDLATAQRLDLTRAEDEAFWSWAIIETLRHTGIRLEELLEITHLALVSYRLPDTGEVVPLLQIVPSKSNEERLLLVSPELASVLATIITRLRRQHGGAIPLVARYDGHERTTGPKLPHLFQRGARHCTGVISYSEIRRLLGDALTRTGLHDAAGQPLHYTPHDFRRIFATEAVTGGLPVHIAARLLGHTSLTTTESYLAVFQHELLRTYRNFLDHRRAVRPAAEYREPTEQEWREFQQHFQLRKLELGTCARPYGTPCQHEHACIRCPMLRVDPKQRRRLTEIIANLTDRITEARANGWLGETAGLQTSLEAAKAKLVNLDKATNNAPGITHLGMPQQGQPGQEKPR
jgi:integrase